MGLSIKLLPLFCRARELFVAQGYCIPETESDALDLISRARGNGVDDMRIVVLSPERVCAASSLGHTSALAIHPDERPEDVRALGEICKAALRLATRSNRS